MSKMKMMFILVITFITAACGGGGGDGTPGLSNGFVELSSEEQAELVSVALSSDQGGIADDITNARRSASGLSQHQAVKPNAGFSFSVTVNVDYYDNQDNLQEGFNEETTDRIDYDSMILGDISGGEGYFTELNIDNRSYFTMENILSRMALINGTHTNNSSYSRTRFITQEEIKYALDCALTVTDITVDLDAEDDFPESGTIEGTISGSHERNGALGNYSSKFSFHFIATYVGDNTAEVELNDGTIIIIRLGNNSVQYMN